MTCIDAHTADIVSIDDPDAANHIEITLNAFSAHYTTIAMTEALAASIAEQIANVLQDRAHERSNAALEATYLRAYNRRQETRA